MPAGCVAGAAMWTEADVRRLLAEFGEDLGLDGFALDGAGHCRLLFDGELEVDIDYDPQPHLLRLTARLGRPRPEALGDLCEALLRANGFMHDTGIALGMEAAADGAGQILQLAVLPLAGLDRAGFEARLEGFARMGLDWRLAVAAAGPATDRPATDRAVTATPGMLV